jgi:hypothetical protein
LPSGTLTYSVIAWEEQSRPHRAWVSFLFPCFMIVGKVAFRMDCMRSSEAVSSRRSFLPLPASARTTTSSFHHDLTEPETYLPLCQDFLCRLNSPHCRRWLSAASLNSKQKRFTASAVSRLFTSPTIIAALRCPLSPVIILSRGP